MNPVKRCTLDTGDIIINPFADEKIVFLKSGIETGGAFSERELHLLPNWSVPKAHIHDYDETFRVVQGTLTLRIDNEILELQAGDSKTVQRGTAHQPQNQQPVELITINRVSPAGKHDLMLAQTHGFLTAKSEPRSKVEFFLQAMLFVDYYGTYTAGLPVGLQKALSFIMAPTARLLGYHTWRPEYSKKWKSVNRWWLILGKLMVVCNVNGFAAHLIYLLNPLFFVRACPHPPHNPSSRGRAVRSNSGHAPDKPGPSRSGVYTTIPHAVPLIVCGCLIFQESFLIPLLIAAWIVSIVSKAKSRQTINN